MQKRRASLLDSHHELQDYILEQEKKRNEHMDAVYQQHSILLEKIFLRHNENSEKITKSLIESSAQTFKSLMIAPIEFLANCFHLSRNISPIAQQEIVRRQSIAALESSLNGQDEFDTNNLDKKKQLDSESVSTGYPAQLSFNI